jgi:hypothetical protein
VRTALAPRSTADVRKALPWVFAPGNARKISPSLTFKELLVIPVIRVDDDASSTLIPKKAAISPKDF